MSTSKKKTTYPEAYTLLLKFYQEANPTKKKENAIREAQNLWNELKSDKNKLDKKIKLLKLKSEKNKIERQLFFFKAARQSQECNALKLTEEPAHVSLATIFEDTIENTTDNETDNSKYRNAEAITYSGPTFIRIHSSKHDTSTAYSHGKDFDDIMNDERLHNFTKTEDGQTKPVILILTDGAPLSHDLAGIILFHDTFGSHLNEQLKIFDERLEKCNFKAAREILASVWEDTVIDGYLGLVEYVDPPEEHYQSSLNEKPVTWIEKHTITCHYITQVVKCDNPSCCRPFHSRIRQLFPNYFFSPPILVQQKPH
ncbi:33362_t:CDS:2, partial [Racocetra persica]